MCSDCFNKQYYGFQSYTEYEEFEGILDFKTRSNKIKILEEDHENTFIDYRMYFQCNTCAEMFVFLIPDNAQRGYFLTHHNALRYHDKQHLTDKNKKYGCLIIIFLLCSLFIYALISNY